MALLTAASCLLLTPVPAAVGIATLMMLLSWNAPAHRRRVLVAGLGLAALALAGVAVVDAESGSPERLAKAIGRSYSALWTDLEASARMASSAIEEPTTSSDDAIVAVFGSLDRLAGQQQLARKTLLLVNPAGDVVAWAGGNLLHEPRGEDLPRSGNVFIQSYTAATAMAVAPLGMGTRPWRLVVGRSYPAITLPFAGAGSRASRARWSLRPEGAATDPGTRVFAVAGAPSLVVDWTLRSAPPRQRALLERSAAGALALTLLAVGLGASERRPRRRVRLGSRLVRSILVAGAAATAAAALVLALPTALALVVSAGLGADSIVSRTGVGRRRRRSWDVALAGAACALGLFAAALTIQRWLGPTRLDGGFFGSLKVLVLRLSWMLGGIGLLLYAARRHDRRTGETTAWLAVALTIAAAATHDLPFVALPLLAAASAAVSLWLGNRRRLDRHPVTIGVALVLVSMLSATSWDAAYRWSFRQHVRGLVESKLGPPSAEELSRLNLELDGFFGELEVQNLALPGHGPTQGRDLAFALWRRSPLPTRDSLSALVVTPDGGVSTSFSFDLPLSTAGAPNRQRSQLRVPQSEAWTANMIEGYGVLWASGSQWGSVRYWLVPRPGFRLEVSEIEELETELLRGRPHRRSADGLPEGVSYALYRFDGSVVASPWPQAPPLPEPARERAAGTVGTPEGRAFYFTTRGRDGISVVYLPLRTPLDALARTGVHSLSTIVLLAAMAPLFLVLRIPRQTVMAGVRQTVRSYARRLMLVYTVLLFLPLVALNFLLLRNVAERLRQDQLAQGETALDSARSLFIDYIVGLEEGFSFDLLMNRQLVEWLSRMVDHQVNLYWNGQLVGSSQQALVTAGFLPGRVPGDIYARLVHRGYKRELRSRERDALTYLELYSPVELAGSSPFILSVPLLEQQEEAARLLDRLRQQAVLISAALFAVLLALGGRLARSFTDPLNQLVEGTRRIAGGAASLELEPRELELSALVRAIDDMARRIADGRNRLLREKQVVDRIVDNITSGVVSLDRQLRVLLHNRAAAERLGTEVGRGIEAALADQPHLDAVRDFVHEAMAGSLLEATVRVTTGTAGEARDWTLTWVPVPGGGDPAALLVVDDDTEVLRGQRLAAWAEMARIIAHEIKNPLTPIRLSAEHMRQVYERDPENFDAVLERCTDNILRQVEELRVIASEFSIYSRIPRAEPTAGDLAARMSALVDDYRDAASAAGVRVLYEGPRRLVAARFDATLFTRAVRNLIENALRASAGRENEPVVVEVVEAPGTVSVCVTDGGPGVPPEMLPRIFEPYFSTHDTGTGLGLPIARRIAEEHGGSIEARNRTGGGLEVTIVVPSSEASSATMLSTKS